MNGRLSWGGGGVDFLLPLTDGFFADGESDGFPYKPVIVNKRAFDGRNELMNGCKDFIKSLMGGCLETKEGGIFSEGGFPFPKPI